MEKDFGFTFALRRKHLLLCFIIAIAVRLRVSRKSMISELLMNLLKNTFDKKPLMDNCSCEKWQAFCINNNEKRFFKNSTIFSVYFIPIFC